QGLRLRHSRGGRSGSCGGSAGEDRTIMTAIAGEAATENLRVQRMDPLPTPAQITREFPLSAPAADLVQRSRAEIADVLAGRDDRLRSEEHTSELQSRFDLVCRLLL